jgi:hypothetical protein
VTHPTKIIPTTPWSSLVGAVPFDGITEYDALGDETPVPVATREVVCAPGPLGAALEAVGLEDAASEDATLGDAALDDGAIVATVRIAPHSIKLSLSSQHIGAPSLRSAQYVPARQYPILKLSSWSLQAEE